MMNQKLFHTETVEGPVRFTRIRVAKGAPMAELVRGLETFWEAGFAQHQVHYLVDMREVLYPSTNFIALLIASTMRARHLKGEVILENLSTTARDNLLTFSALNYLAHDHLAPVAVPTETARQESPQPLDDELDPNALVEIAEPPLVRELEGEVHAAPISDRMLGPAFLAREDIQSYSLKAESKAAKLYQLCDFVVEHARRAGMKDKEIGKIRIAVYEACLNVIEHAYHSNPDNWIDLSVHYNQERLVIVIQDNGLSFELKPPRDYDVQEAVNNRRTGGFGMHIIRRAVDHLEYHPDAVHGNRLVLIKNLATA